MNLPVLLAQADDAAASSGGFLDKIKAFFEVFGDAGPWVLALIIIVVGYYIAKIIRKVVEKALSKTTLDDKLAKLLGQESTGSEKGIGAFVFYVLLLFIVIFALDTAGQQETVEPLKQIFTDILGAVPLLLAAGVILFAAWIIATVVRKILEGILGASKVDESLGLGDSKPITNGVGMVAFFGIILMMLPPALGKLQMPEISEPIQSMVDQIFAYIPSLFGGIILFAIGYLVASIVQKVLANVLGSIGVDNLPSRIGFKGEAQIAGKPLSDILSYVAMATILVVIGAQAIKTMNLGFISELAEGFVPGYFNILAAIFIVCVGLYVANLVGQMIEGKSAFWAQAARIAILVFIGAVALQKANISNLTDETFQILINCAIVAVAFAVGVGGAIAIGLGGRDKAKDMLDKLGK